jgi:hypothetical protein
MFTWWTNPTPGIKYLRADLPAGALGGVCLDIEVELSNRDNGGDLWKNHKPNTPGIWQLVSNQVRYMAFREQRLFAPVYLDIDDDYTKMHREYNAKRWVEYDYETPDLTTSSIECHRWVAGFADGVIVTTPYLRKQYLELNDNVYICRNSVNPDDWPIIESSIERDPDEFVIMFAGSPRPGDLKQLRRGMEWAAKQPGVKCYMVHDLKMGFRGVRTTGWQAFENNNYFNFISSLKPDLSLRPLETTEFAKSKSDLKILEAAMAGAYSLVQAWEPYSEWIKKDRVMWAATEKDWEKQIKYAVNNRDEIRYKAVELRKHVIETRSIDIVKNDWINVFLDAPYVEDIRNLKKVYA